MNCKDVATSDSTKLEPGSLRLIFQVKFETKVMEFHLGLCSTASHQLILCEILQTIKGVSLLSNFAKLHSFAELDITSLSRNHQSSK